MQPVLTAVMNSGAQLLFFPLFQPEGNHAYPVNTESSNTAGFVCVFMSS